MSFYVYTLSDPRTGCVFYVGKGKGNRLDHHEAEAQRGKRSRKCDRIRDIWAAGEVVAKRIVERFEIEDEAFEREICLIAEIGLGNLTNVLPGGQGRVPPSAMTPEQIKARYRERRLRPKIEAMARQFADGAVFPLEKNGREMGRVFLAAIRSLTGGSPAPAWNPQVIEPFTVLGLRFEGPTPIQALLQIAIDPRVEVGIRMDALHSMTPYCHPMAAKR